MKRKSLALILVFALVISLLPLSVFANDLEKFNYVAIGASETNGFGLVGYTGEAIVKDGKLTEQYIKNPSPYRESLSVCTGFECTSTRSYPVLVKEFLETRYKNQLDVNLYQFAQCGMRFEDLRVLLDDNYDGDGYTEWRFYDKSKSTGWFLREAEGLEGYEEASISSLSNKYKNALSNANLITIELGSNSFSTFVMNALLYGMFDVSFEDVFEGEEDRTRYDDLRTLIIEEIVKASNGKLSKDAIEQVAPFAEVVPYAFVSYCKNLDKCVEIIRDLNPNAQIIFMGIPEFSSNVSVSLGSIDIPFADLVNVLIDTANIYAKNLSKERKQYTFVPLYYENGIASLKDDILEYNGEFLTGATDLATERMLSEIEQCFSVYDRDMLVLPKIYKALREKLPDEEDSKVLNLAEESAKYAYDYFAKAVKVALEKEVIDAENFINVLGLQGIENKLRNFAENVLKVSVNAAYKDAYPEAGNLLTAKSFDFDSILEDESFIDILALYAAAYLGNSYFLHPNETGHMQMAAAVISEIGSTENPIEKMIVEAVKDQITEIKEKKEATEEFIKEEAKVAGEIIAKEAKAGAIWLGKKLVKAVDYSKKASEILLENLEDVQTEVREFIEEHPLDPEMGREIAIKLYDNTKAFVSGAVRAISSRIGKYLNR